MANAKSVFLLFLSSFFFAACGTVGEIRQGPPQNLTSDHTLLVVDGDLQENFVGEALETPLQVRLEEGGRPLKNFPVVFEIESGDAFFLSEKEAQTDENGEAQLRLQLGSTAGDVRVTATAATKDLIETQHRVTFKLKALPIHAKKLFLGRSETNGQTGTVDEELPLPLEVLAKDEKGRVVSSAPIEFRLLEGPAETSFNSATVTNAEGLATTNVRLAEIAGDVRIEAVWTEEDVPEEHRSVAFTIFAKPALAADFAILEGYIEEEERACRVENDDFSTFRARLIDRFGNPIPHQAVEIAPSTILSVNGKPYGDAVGSLYTDVDGAFSFAVRAGTLRGEGYNQTGSLTIRTVGLDENASRRILVDVTKSKYLFSLEETNHFYGSTRFSVICYRGEETASLCSLSEVDLSLELVSNCWNPIRDEKIHARLEIRTRASEPICATPNGPWDYFASDVSSEGTNDSGQIILSTLTLLQYLAISQSGEMMSQTNKLTLYAEGTNEQVFYFDPTECAD